jgi:ferritin-like metal-binding protein YciE
MRWLLLSFLLFLQAPLVFSQETSDPAPAEDSKPIEKKLDSLQTIAEPLSESVVLLQQLQKQLQNAATEDVKEDIQARIDETKKRISGLRENFREILGGSEAAEYDTTIIETAGFQEQITELVQPVLSGIREATAEPRELDSLRNQLVIWKERKAKTEKVRARIEKLKEDAKDEVVVAELNSAENIWKARQSDATSQIAVLSVQIEERTKDQRSLWESLSNGTSDFFKSRGMNLLLAVLAAVIGFIAVRKIYALIRKVSPVHKADKHDTLERLSDILSMAVAVLVALGGIIFVFYAKGDWLLLTLVIIFLIGVIWAGKTAIPPYLEQIRMILNLSSVREGERVIYEGLPWKVEKLGFFTTFTNPNLQGGKLRMPIKNVMDMISRPLAPKEVWFPTEADDWLILSDDTYGKSITQTPDQVVLLQLGGAMKTYPTADFLALAPKNLSHGFRISVTFGIDYMHQAESTTTVPEIFQAALTKELISGYGREAVRSINVEFASAGASSLDYVILADFAGSVAHRYNALQRKIQSICVDVCNEQNWGIPFAQITIHRATEED